MYSAIKEGEQNVVLPLSLSLSLSLCVFIKLHITAQSGPVIIVILCHSR